MSVDARLDTVLAGYRIERLLGRGGMSVVYLAEHLRLKRKVALKLLSTDLAADDRFRERFLRESQLAASLDHPNVIPIYDADEADGVLYIAMRYVDGTDLREFLQAEGALEPVRALQIIAQAAAGLDAAHRRGLVHRDIKPGNILIGEDEHVYLSDFGLTKQASSQTGLTLTGQLVGTVDYVAPEQIQGQAVDGRADIYSLAGVLYECLAGAKPFERDTEVAVLWAHIQDPPVPLHDWRPDLPTGVDEALVKGLAKRPEDRYSTCRELVDAVRRELGISSGEIPQPVAQPRFGVGRRSALGAGLLAALLIAVAIVLFQGGPGTKTVIAAPNEMAVIDPVSNRVVESVPVGTDPADAAAGPPGLWVANLGDNTLSRIDSSLRLRTFVAGIGNLKPGPRAGGPAGASRLVVTVGAGSTWAASTGGGTIGRVQGDRAELFEVAPRPAPGARLGGIVATANAVWVLEDSTHSALLRVDPLTGRVTARVPGFSGAQDLVAGYGSIWVADTAAGAVVRVDERTHVVRGTIAIRSGPFALAAGFGSIWAVVPGSGLLWRIDPLTNSVVSSVKVGPDATGVATGGGAVWIMHSNAGSVERIDPATSTIVRTIRVGHHLGGIAFALGKVWTSVDDADQMLNFEGGLG